MSKSGWTSIKASDISAEEVNQRPKRRYIDSPKLGGGCSKRQIDMMVDRIIAINEQLRVQSQMEYLGAINDNHIEHN